MSAQYNIMKTMGVTGAHFSSAIGQKEPVAHPQNCKNECPYGYDKSFCFPCYAKLMSEHRANKKTEVKEA